MAEENIIEGPPLERIIDTNLGVVTMMLLSTQADSVVQVGEKKKIILRLYLCFIEKGEG